MLDFESNENLGLVEFHRLWNGFTSVWLWWGEWRGGTRCSGDKSVGGKLADCGAYAEERVLAAGTERIQPRGELRCYRQQYRCGQLRERPLRTTVYPSDC
jgi:hypothetical protein